jgi:uncharacterized protein (TIGR00369 family)
MSEVEPVLGVTYPPARHILRALAYEVEHRPDLTSTAHMTVGPHLLDERGAIETGALATLVDATGGGLAAWAAHPDWIATADLTVHLLRPATAATVTAHGRVIRRGRTTIVLGVDLVDDHERDLGTATMSFAVLPRRDGNPVVEPATNPVRHAFVPVDDAPYPPLPAAIGIALDGPDAVAPMTPFVVNSLGAMQGGAVASLAAAAATAAADAVIGRPTVCLDLGINYLSLGKVGPIRAVPRVLRAEPTWCLVAIEVRDHGNDDRLMTVVRAVAAVATDAADDGARP